MDYKPDRQGMGLYLRTSPELAHLLMEAAEHGANAARAAAPVDSGAYRDSIRAEDAGIDSRGRNARMATRVVADVPYAADVEFRSGSQRPLQAAVNAIEGGA
jgi:hypothetical protein